MWCAVTDGPSSVPSEPHGRLSLGDPAGWHDEDAVVVGCADLAPAVACDHGADLRDHLEAAVVLRELEAVALDGDRVGHGDRPLLGGRARAVPLGLRGREHAALGEEAP